MPGSRTLALVILFTCALLAPATAQDRPTLIRQSYAEALGMQASNDEVNYWNGRGDWSTKDQLIAFHMQGLRSDTRLQDAAIKEAYYRNGSAIPSDALRDYWRRSLSRNPRVVATLAGDVRNRMINAPKWVDESYRAAFGRPASSDEIKYWTVQRADYESSGALMENHRNYIRGNEAAAEEIVKNSYQNAFGRQPNQGERNFWFPLIKERGYLCSEVQSAHKDWYNRELKRIASNPQIMNNIRQAGFAVDQYGNLIKVDADTRFVGNTIVAGGGGNLIGDGGGTIVAAGGGNIVAAGGGNVVARAGTYLIGHDGATLIGDGGGTLIGK